MNSESPQSAEINNYFTTIEASQRLDLIRHLIENSELTPLLRGPAGSGKTQIAEKLKSIAPDSWYTCYFEADKSMQPERLLNYLSRCVSLSDISGEILQRLIDRFETLRSNGRIPVILVDNAHLLPPASLIILLRLYERQISGMPLVSVVLFADEQIDQLLSTPQLQVMSPQSIHIIDIPPLTREEATSYMRFLLKREGVPSHIQPDAGKLNKMYKDTGGVIGPLTDAIISGVTETGKEETAGGSIFKSIVLWGLPLTMLIGGILYFQDEINQLITPKRHVLTPVVKAGVDEKPAVTITPLPPLPPQKGSVATVSEQAKQASPTSSPQETKPTKPKVGQSPTVELAAAKPIEVPPADSGKPQPAAMDESAKLAPETNEPESGKPVSGRQEPAPVVAVPAELEKPEETASKTAIKQAKPVAKPLQPPKPEVKQNRKQLPGTSWVRTQPANNYTIQLLAAENLETLQNFIKKNGIGSTVHYVKTTRDGGPWYSLLRGSYTSRQTAINRRDKLPSRLTKHGAWIRRFDSLQPALAD